jgi:hypothetical protein
VGITLAKWLWIYGGDKFLKPKAHKIFHRRKPTTYYYSHEYGPADAHGSDRLRRSSSSSSGQRPPPLVRLRLRPDRRALHSRLSACRLLGEVGRWVVLRRLNRRC